MFKIGKGVRILVPSILLSGGIHVGPIGTELRRGRTTKIIASILRAAATVAINDIIKLLPLNFSKRYMCAL